MPRDRRTKRDVHALDEHGMVLCNPRDKEAAHRAEMDDIATAEDAAVTCLKCLTLISKRKESRTEERSELRTTSLNSNSTRSRAGRAMNDPLVTLTDFRFVSQADLARMVLEQEGIPAFIADGNTVTADWFLGNAVGYVKLQVAASQVEAALAILRQNPELLEGGRRSDDEEDDRNACLACGEIMPDEADRCSACGWSYESEESEAGDESDEQDD
jgi:hypothetical protein